MPIEQVQLPQGVKLMELTPEKSFDIWNKMNQIPGLFDDITQGRVDIFIEMLRAPSTVWLERTDGNGILYLTSVIPGLSASGHIVYWDKRLRGREEFTLNCLRWLMQIIPLQKVNIYIPEYAASAKAFTQRLGFKKEGTIRKWSWSNGKLFDIIVFGITFEEAFNGRLYESTSNGVRSEGQGVSEPDSAVLPVGDASNSGDKSI